MVGDKRPVNIPVEPPQSPVMAESAYSSSILLIASVTFAIVACLLWFLRLRSKKRRVFESDTPSTDEIQQFIATKLEAKMLRRTRKRGNVEA